MLLPSALVSLARTEWGISVPNTLNFAAIGLPQQGGDFPGKVGTVSTIVSRMPSIWSLGFSCRLTLLMVDSSCSRPLAGRYSAWDGDYDPVGAASALTVSIPREGWQSIRIWEYCPLSVSSTAAESSRGSWHSPGIPPCRRAGCRQASGPRPPGGAGCPRRV